MAEHSNGNGVWSRVVVPMLSSLLAMAAVVGLTMTPLTEQVRVLQEQVRDHQLALDANKTIGSPLAQRNAERIDSLEADVKSIMTEGSPSHRSALERVQNALDEHTARIGAVESALSASRETFREVETQFRMIAKQLEDAIAAVREYITTELGHLDRRTTNVEHRLYGNGFVEAPGK